MEIEKTDCAIQSLSVLLVERTLREAILPCSLIRQYGLHACCLDPRILSPALVREISWPAACLLASDVAQDGALTGINKVCLFMMC
jgi:hypothetical protein